MRGGLRCVRGKPREWKRRRCELIGSICGLLATEGMQAFSNRVRVDACGFFFPYPVHERSYMAYPGNLASRSPYRRDSVFRRENISLVLIGSRFRCYRASLRAAYGKAEWPVVKEYLLISGRHRSRPVGGEVILDDDQRGLQNSDGVTRLPGRW